MSEKHRALFQGHCVSCHKADKQKGHFRVDDLPFTIKTVEDAERWQKVLNAMNAGDMPPEEEKQPDSTAKTDFLDDLSHVMVAARRQFSDQNGVITMRRLNRREYRNTIRELLGVEINVSELPADTGAGGFDTNGVNLFMSANQFEQYQSLGREALTEAIAWHAAAGEQRKLRYEAEVFTPVMEKFVAHQLDARERAQRWVQAVDAAAAKPENAGLVAAVRKTVKNETLFRREWAKIPGAPSPRSFGFDKKGENDADLANDSLRAGWLEYHQYYLRQPALDRGAYLGPETRHPAELNLKSVNVLVPFNWPVGNYIVRVRAGVTKDAPPERRFLDFGINARQGPVLATREITGTIDEPQVVEFPLTLTRGNSDHDTRTIYFREKGAWDTNESGGKRRSEAVARNGLGPELVMWIDWVEVERVPATGAKPTPPGLAALHLPLDDKAPAPSSDDLRASLERFAMEAFRGSTPTPQYVDRLLGIYDMRRKLGDKPGAALKETLSVVLASPMFLYLAEPAANEEHRVLTAPELASRLSYYLWSAPPDAELRALAKNGEILKPEVLAAQTRRLLDDSRSDAFVRSFVYQWLGMDRFDFFEINRQKYPRFDNGTKLSAREEVYATFDYLLRHNASLRDLLKSDYVIVDRVLAHYYGLDGVQGSGFERVRLPADSPRGGLLGMAAIHFMGSNGEHTSPVERGAWVLRKLLDDPPPPAPPNIPALTRLAGKALTTPDRLRMHQEDPQCASCHRKIDPVGMGLENFDAAGQWRTADSYQAVAANGRPDPKLKIDWTIDVAATFHKGGSFKNYGEFREIIASRAENFARGFSKALLEYALGRPLGFRDEAVVADLVKQAKTKDYAIREFVHLIVISPEFRNR
ncbi:cytochrome c [Roseimicrobium gellanilyticum]|uniref:Cytochrome c n=1 Tax=Roseimicrobium gellanilyticum TaxID=748857 RepID=A0A366HL92_9BACT|nr:DUF1592 domain-containing protein [Roseimicrobium gellanilyticum]RBP43634.1 cytochrome c [Roseimicrobium gellanilyticum]